MRRGTSRQPRGDRQRWQTDCPRSWDRQICTWTLPIAALPTRFDLQVRAAFRRRLYRPGASMNHSDSSIGHFQHATERSRLQVEQRAAPTLAIEPGSPGALPFGCEFPFSRSPLAPEQERAVAEVEAAASSINQRKDPSPSRQALAEEQAG
jgi:hypothetical protein